MLIKYLRNMRVEYLYSGSKWEILQELANKPQSTSELAKALNTSQANISQQLKHLELAGIIERKRASRKNIHYTYHITGYYTHTVHIGPGIANQKTRTKQQYEQLVATLYTHKHATALLTLILGKPELFSYANTIAILDRDKPEILVTADNIEPFRQNASIELQTLQGNIQVAVWSHTNQEIEQGIQRADEYFIKLAQEYLIAYDPDGELYTYKQQANEAIQK